MKKCRFCGIEFKPSKENKIYCCHSCARDSRKRQYRDKSRREAKSKAEAASNKVITCPSCGDDYVRKNGGYKYCSDKCAKRSASINRNHARRSTKYGVRKISKIFFGEVFLEYKGICNICKKQLSVDDRGLNIPSAPEIDHIMPLSKGGSNDRSNIQLLCKSCNVKKGDKVL